MASSGLKKPLIQRVIDHKAGLLRTRVVGEKTSREESEGVIEHGDVGSGSRVDQGRGSQEGDTAGGGGGDVGQDREVWSDGCECFDEEDDRSEVRMPVTTTLMILVINQLHRKSRPNKNAPKEPSQFGALHWERGSTRINSTFDAARLSFFINSIGASVGGLVR